MFLKKLSNFGEGGGRSRGVQRSWSCPCARADPQGLGCCTFKPAQTLQVSSHVVPELCLSLGRDPASWRRGGGCSVWSPLEVDGASKRPEPGEGDPSPPTTVTEHRGGFLRMIICCFPSCSFHQPFFFFFILVTTEPALPSSPVWGLLTTSRTATA